MMNDRYNHRRLLLAFVFIAINLIILPSRITIKSGFEAVGVDSSPAVSSSLGEAISIRAGRGLPWTESYEPRQTKVRNVRVSFRLHDVEDEPRPDKFLSVDSFFCRHNRTDLPRTLQTNGDGRLFDFTTTVSTDLRLVFMGDSLGHQFCQGFEAAVLGRGHERKRTVQKSYNIGRKIFDCLASSAPVRGGGAVAFWRYTKLLQRKAWAKITPCYSNERLWGENFLMELLDHKFSDEPEGREMTVDQFDAAVVRIPHGWMAAEEITKERLEEVVTFAQNLLGVRVVIFTTVGLDNNAIGPEQWAGVEKINEYVHDIAKNFKPTSVDGVQWIMVQEWSRFTSQIIRENGLSMGYNISSNDFYFERLVGGETSWAQSVPMVCANKPKDNLHSECKRNKISPDGIHWCVETLGPRFTASIACLLGCAYNERPPDRATQRGVSSLRKCEHECNEQFMSLTRIGDEYIGKGLTLHSTSSTR